MSEKKHPDGGIITKPHLYDSCGEPGCFIPIDCLQRLKDKPSFTFHFPPAITEDPEAIGLAINGFLKRDGKLVFTLGANPQKGTERNVN